MAKRIFEVIWLGDHRTYYPNDNEIDPNKTYNTGDSIIQFSNKKGAINFIKRNFITAIKHNGTDGYAMASELKYSIRETYID